MVALDGTEHVLTWPREGVVRFARGGDEDWLSIEAAPERTKSPLRAGPFKDAWRNGVVLVVGTGGTEEERALTLAKARFDAAQFRYRGNGALRVILDTAFDPARIVASAPSPSRLVGVLNRRSAATP